MVGPGIVRRFVRHGKALGIYCALAAALALPVLAQVPGDPPGAPIVAEVRVLGNRTVSEGEIRSHINTRAGRPYDKALAKKDARSLVDTTKFFDAQARSQPGPSPGTVIVTFEVVEFPKIGFIHIVGNDTIKKKIILKQSGLKVGDPYSLDTVHNARNKIEEFYREHGYNQVRVEVRKGLDSKDGGVGFVIHEGPAQKIWSVSFVGNTIVSGARLETLIESKPGLLKYIKGYVNTTKIDQDVEKLEAYYKDLGYRRAKVSRELQYDKSGKWLYLTYVIDEGPRFKVRNISFEGNTLFTAEQLRRLVELNEGDNVDGPKLFKTRASLTDAYGGVGYIMVNVNPSVREEERTPEADLVFEIKEGSRYRIGNIKVVIGGENPHTRQEVVLNRLSFRPGEIADLRKIRDSERRLRASAVFANDPNRPKLIVFDSNNGDGQEERTAAPKPRAIRGQSPDDVPGDMYAGQSATADSQREIEYYLYPVTETPTPVAAPAPGQAPGEWPPSIYGGQP